MDIALIVFRCKVLFKSYVRGKFGRDFNFRLENQIRRNFTFYARFEYEYKIEASKKAIVKFI